MPLNVNSNIKKEKQDCKISTVCVGWGVGEGRVKEGD
jgi:hypothetical protein